MIEIKPDLKLFFTCPECNCKDITVSELVFPGIRILADCTCFCCDNNFFADLPTGHALYYPKTLSKKSGKVYPEEKKMNWFSRQLWESFQSKDKQEKLEIEIVRYRDSGKEVVVLNCLDYLYGHVLLKLFNADAYLKSEASPSLILIVPTTFKWLIPEGVSEVWLINASLDRLRNWQSEFNSFIQTQFTRFDKIFLSPAYSHPDFSSFDISKFTKVAPFKLENFSANKPVITFIYREDRLWHSYRWQEFLFLISSRLLFSKTIKSCFVFLQNLKIKAFFRNMKKEIPDAEFVLVGLGTSGKFSAGIQDKRVAKMDQNLEKQWSEIYASSNLVVGIHGSNMLLPSAHAAAFLELLPDSRIGNITQDIVPRFNAKYMLYLGRHISSSLSPKHAAKHAVAIVKGFPVFDLYNNPINIPTHAIQKPQEISEIYKKLTQKKL